MGGASNAVRRAQSAYADARGELPAELWRRLSRFSFTRRRISRLSLDRFGAELASDERTLVVHSRDLDHRRYFPNSVVIDKARDAEPDPWTVPYLEELQAIDDASFSLVVATGLLEHVSEPERLVRELHRVLVPGGRLIVTASAVFSFHGAPYEFFHFTPNGFRFLFRDWSRFQVLRGSSRPFETVAILLQRINLQCAVFPPVRPLVELLYHVLPRLDTFVLREYDGVSRDEQSFGYVMPAALHAVVVK
jgi:SAM-dependent methyltransferase